MIVNAVPRMLARYGRAMTLRRRIGTGTTFNEATADGYIRAFSPEEITGGVMEGDARVILDAEPLTSLAPPRKGDFIVIDNKTWSVLGAHARMVTDNVAAYDLWVRGG
ncbi:MAG: hypothetical protein INF64_15005 [Roseomonas sp.]|nr:hypothetical protein [Roseomonas sp.]